jgi:enoyl-CoA hydratase/carnithine racemase
MKRFDARGFEPTTFRWSFGDRVGNITLNRPEKKNPLTFDMYAELRDTFRALNDAPDVRAIVLSGAGENFSSGGDVHEIIGPLVGFASSGNAGKLLEFTRMTGDLVKAMRACPQPIVAAVDGICAGAGAILAMASDLRYGTERSKVAFLFVRVGLAGADMGACAILPRIIGHGRASELLYSGRFMLSDEAERWGFYNKVVPAAELLSVATSVARTLADGPTLAHATTKRAMHEEWHMSIDDAIDYEARVQARCMQSEDFARAYRAFVAKQQPKFEGN